MWDNILSVSSAYLLTAVLALLIIFYFRRRYRCSNLPPGPKGLPIVGYAPFLGSQPHVTLSRLAEKYGDIMSFNLNGRTVVHLKGVGAIRDAFSNQGEEFSGCLQDFTFLQCLLDGQGISQSEGPVWKEHRRFVQHAFRDFGFGKGSMEARINEVSADLVKELKGTEGNPVDPFDMLYNCVANVICSIVFNHRYSLTDPDFIEFRELIVKAMNQLPELDLIVPFPKMTLKSSSRYQEMLKVKEGIHAMIQKHVQHHEETFDGSNLRDYLDVYLEERRRAAEEGTLEKSSFSLYRLICNCFNFFLSGTDTVASTMHWALKLMMVHQKVQEKIQKEVEEAFGRDQTPSWMERSKLPYTEAAIEELLRFSSVVAISPSHSTLEEITLQDYTIPKRSSVIANLWSAHNDPKYWPDAEKYDPVRFISPDGRFTKREGFIPFSVGKRVCPGESLARMELFIFLTTILQHFNIRMPEGESDQDFEPQPHFLRKLKPYRLCAVPR